jgi:hypothetical protein
VLYVDRTVTVRGGYAAPTFTDPPDPVANPTTLDAQGQVRVMFIIAPAPDVDISPTIEGLRLTGGAATGPGQDPWREDIGGGVYVVSATATISGNQILSSIAAADGSGLYLDRGSATLINNVVADNPATARAAGCTYGGERIACCTRPSPGILVVMAVGSMSRVPTTGVRLR